MQTEDAIVFTTGYQANLGLHRHDPRARRHGDLRLGRPRLDPRRLQALRRQAAAFRHNQMAKLERMLERAAGDGGGVLVVVDGVFSMEGDVCDLPPIVELCGATAPG